MKSNPNALQAVIEAAGLLSREDLRRLSQQILDALSLQVIPSTSLHELASTEYEKSGAICRACGSRHITLNGKDKNGNQRYLCHECGKTFASTSHSVLARTQKDVTTWLCFLDCLLSGKSIRDTAEICKIAVHTSFDWRHKVLDALVSSLDATKLCGIIEADETFVRISYKGNHSKSKDFVMPRPSKYHGAHAGKSGMSKELVCISCAIDRSGSSTTNIAGYGRITTAACHAVLDNHVTPSSVLVTDKASAYIAFAKECRLELIQLAATKIKGKGRVPTISGIYHTQTINSYHSRLKKFLKQFNGVSTKYLGNYLTLFSWLENHKELRLEARKTATMDDLMRKVCDVRLIDISNRPVLPMAA